MVRVKFKFWDEFTTKEGMEQECTVSSLEECKKIYGLGTDPTCEYQIISVEEV